MADRVSRIRRRVCFVTGTRAEFGLMQSVLEAIRDDPSLTLQIIATGMHLDASRGSTLKDISAAGWEINAVVPWPLDTAIAVPLKSAFLPPPPVVRGRVGAGAPRHAIPTSDRQWPRKTSGSRAIATGQAMAGIAAALEKLHSDIVLVVGDRVEAFAAASAAVLSGRVLAHIHGGDRALGQADDSLRHAISKLAHVHFPATAESAARLLRLGEDKWRIHRVGSPGIDGIVQSAAPWSTVAEDCPGLTPHRYALVVLHPIEPDPVVEARRAENLLSAALSVGVDRAVIVYPNNDPGAQGILRQWRHAAKNDRCLVKANVRRDIFLGLLRDAALIVGNSSSGIIEAASFHTPAINVGPRQAGRERCADVIDVSYDRRAIRQAVGAVWNKGRPKRSRSPNPYAAGQPSGKAIARILSQLHIDNKILSKLIAY
ncbi:MAG: UDP-N-acetylglucosamine 2-epimerase [Tepidisphaeraceae bacterium]|jgi:UDP-hydrolysing UDP-N-acetyl-D-glucosamine 2-epimerase